MLLAHDHLITYHSSKRSFWSFGHFELEVSYKYFTKFLIDFYNSTIHLYFLSDCLPFSFIVLICLKWSK